MTRRVLTLLLGLACSLTVGLPVTPTGAVQHPARSTGPAAPQLSMLGNLGLVTSRVRVRAYWTDTGWTEPPPGEPDLSFDVQILRTGMRSAARPDWRDALVATTTTKKRFALASGTILCVRVRQHSFGVTSGWTARNCVVRPSTTGCCTAPAR